MHESFPSEQPLHSTRNLTLFYNLKEITHINTAQGSTTPSKCVKRLRGSQSCNAVNRHWRATMVEPKRERVPFFRIRQ